MKTCNKKSIFSNLSTDNKRFIQEAINRDIPPAMDLKETGENMEIEFYSGGLEEGFSLWNVHNEVQTAHLLKLWTHPHLRGKGVAFQHLSSCVKRFQERGLRIFWLEVASDNDSAIKLYRRLGFTGFEVGELFPGGHSGYRMEMVRDASLD